MFVDCVVVLKKMSWFLMKLNKCGENCHILKVHQGLCRETRKSLKQNA